MKLHKKLSLALVMCIATNLIYPAHAMDTIHIEQDKEVNTVRVDSINLLQNSSYEVAETDNNWVGGLRPTKWSYWDANKGTTQKTIDNEVYHTGSKSVKMSSTVSNGRGALLQELTVSCIEPQSYKLKTWVKTQDISNGALIRYQVNGATTIVDSINGTNDWTLIETVIALPTGINKIKVELFLENSKGTVWFDDVTLESYIAVEELIVDEKVVNLQIGEEKVVGIEIKPKQASNQKVEWTSSNEVVATVESGKIIAHQAGYTLINVRSLDSNEKEIIVVNVGQEDRIEVEEPSIITGEEGYVEHILQGKDTESSQIEYSLLQGQPKNGQVTLTKEGKMTYYPNKGFSGEDEVWILACVDGIYAEPVRVNIQVRPINTAPEADINWSYTLMNTALTSSLKFEDANGDNIQYEKYILAKNGMHGQVELTDIGVYTYTPQQGYTGYDTFEVIATDSKNASTTATITVYVGPSREQITADWNTSIEANKNDRKSLFFPEEQRSLMRENLETDSYIMSWVDNVKERADIALTKEPISFGTKDPWHAIAENMVPAAIMYALTDEEVYAERAWKELENMASYPEWYKEGGGNELLILCNMTEPAVLTYDLLADYLIEEQCNLMREAFTEKALKSKRYLGWLRNDNEIGFTNNIGVVGNSIASLAALCVMDGTLEQQSLGAETLELALKKIQNSMCYYGKEGAWPELTSYYCMTSHNISLYLGAMNNTIGKDYGMTNLKSFAKSGSYFNHIMGPNGPANFADIGTSLFNPFTLWFADFYDKPEYAWHQGQLMKNGATHRMTYYYFLNYRPGMFGVQPKELDAYYSGAETISMRNSWEDEQAIYLVGKGVDEKLHSHVDLDAGTFELDALGVRWATEVGAESYGLPGFWDYNYRRWTYYRKRPEGHNTLVINPKEHTAVQQVPYASAEVIKNDFKPQGAYSIVDLSDVYIDAAKAQRGFKLFNNRKEIIIQDEIRLKKSSEVYWFMHTYADIEIIEGGKAALLSRDGKRLYVKLIVPEQELKFTVMDAKPLPGTINPSGQKNNDVFKKLSIHMEDIVEAKYAIWMVPLNEWDEIPESTPKFEALADWKIQEGEIQRNPIETIKIDGKVIEGFSRNQDVHYVDVAANKTKVPEVEVVADGEVTIEHAQTLPGHTKVTVTKEGLTTNHYIAFEKDTLKGAPQEAVRYPIQDATVSVGNNPMQTIDGNLGTRWSTEGKQWIEYDLGQVQEVNAVSIAMPWGDQQKYLIDLEVSEDNVNWQNVWNGKSSGTSDKMETYLFDRVPARYVRINVNGNHINTTNNISEVAIYNIEETELQPQVTLVGSGEVMGGEVFDVNIEINGLERLVYAQDLMINYDTKVFELIGVEGIDPSIIVHQEENEEGLRLMIATEGGLASGKDAVILLFRARDVSQESEGEVVITTAELGVVKEGIAEIVRPEKSKVNIKVKPNTSTEVDKAILMSTIAVAEELSNNANIGNDIGQYPQEEKDKLDQAIIVAKQIAKDSVNQVEIDGATRTLLEGINEFKASQIVSASEDVNKDNAVNVADLALVAYYYTATPESDNWKEANRADINKDNRVDVGDLARVASRILEK